MLTFEKQLEYANQSIKEAKELGASEELIKSMERARDRMIELKEK